MVKSKKLEISFDCARCVRKFRVKCNLEKHLETHCKKKRKISSILKGNNSYKCVDCGRILKSRGRLQFHSIFHKPQQHCCIECGQKFFTLGSLRCHTKYIHSGNPIKRRVQAGKQLIFPCSNCGKQFANLSDLQTHSLGHVPRAFKCSLCGVEFRLKGALDIHLVKMHSITATPVEHKCGICQIIFKTASGLMYHSAYHGVPKFECNQCDLRFYHNSALSIHTKHAHTKRWSIPSEISTNQRAYSCAICCRPFGPNYHSLIGHLEVHYDKALKCPECHHMISSQRHFKKHMKDKHQIVAAERFSCEICKREFRCRSGLQVHNLYHKDPEFGCPNCAERFYHPVFLAGHLKKCSVRLNPTEPINKTGKFSCSICLSNFKRKGMLQNHLVTHKSEFLVCPFCNVSCKCVTSLKRHAARFHAKLPNVYVRASEEVFGYGISLCSLILSVRMLCRI